MKLLHRIDRFLKGLNVVQFIIIITIGMVLGSLCFGMVSKLFTDVEIAGAGPKVMQESFSRQIIEAVILAPLLETLLFQMCVIKLLKKIKILKNNSVIIVMISAVIFGLQHFYSLHYIMNTTIAGIFLAYAYIAYEKKKESAFCVVSIIHGLRNLIALITTCMVARA